MPIIIPKAGSLSIYGTVQEQPSQVGPVDPMQTQQPQQQAGAPGIIVPKASEITAYAARPQAQPGQQDLSTEYAERLPPVQPQVEQPTDEEQGFVSRAWEGAKDIVTGESRQVPSTEALPELIAGEKFPGLGS